MDNDYIYDNYWFNSGTPFYLVKLIETNNYSIIDFNSNSIEKGRSELLAPYSVKDLDLPILLYQSGYLSITNKETLEGSIYFTLDFPNISVRSSFYDILCSFISTKMVSETKKSIIKALNKADFKLLEDTIKILFASIPHQYNPVMGDISRITDYEGYYSSILFAYLKATTAFIEGEISTNHGRLDLYVKTANNHYIFEFKATETGALAQIEDRKYYEKYLDDTKRDLYLSVINFDVEDKNISKLKYKKLN